MEQKYGYLKLLLLTFIFKESFNLYNIKNKNKIKIEIKPYRLVFFFFPKKLLGFHSFYQFFVIINLIFFSYQLEILYISLVWCKMLW